MFKVKTDLSSIKTKIKNDIDEINPILSQQVLVDCNYYCKQDQGGLINSSLTSSYTEKGELIWDTPYAKKQYYLGTANKDANENASKMWCHKARARFGKDWSKQTQKALENKNLRKAWESQIQSSITSLYNETKDFDKKKKKEDK